MLALLLGFAAANLRVPAAQAAARTQHARSDPGCVTSECKDMDYTNRVDKDTPVLKALKEMETSKIALDQAAAKARTAAHAADTRVMEAEGAAKRADQAKTDAEIAATAAAKAAAAHNATVADHAEKAAAA